MGDWNTLHVFDDRRFHEEIVPMLRGRKVGVEEHYEKFLTRSPRCDVGIEEMVPLFRQFSADFTRHPGYDALLAQDGNATFDRIHRGEYYTRRFFEFVVFSECASFFPYFVMGYRQFGAAVRAKEGDTVVDDLLLRISHGNADNPWKWDGDGIRSWMSTQEVKVLLDSGSIVPRREDEAEYVQDFLRFLGVVTKNKLGLLSACDILSDDLKGCAPPHLNKDLWTGVEMGTLVWEHRRAP